MAYTFKKKLANRENYGSKRSLSKIKKIVIHFTANDGDKDENNGKYFANNVTKTSAHYFVDSDSVTQSVPDDYVAYAVGGKKYSNCSTTGGGKFYGTVTNTNSLSIELCDDVKNGVIYPSPETIANAIELTKQKMKEYNLTANDVIRHFDVNGKPCPGYWCGNKSKNALWETEFKSKLTDKKTTTSKTQPLTVASNIADIQTYLNTYYKDEIVDVLGKTLKVDGLSGANTRKGLAIAFQVELNKLGAELKVDGDFGSGSSKAFTKYVGTLKSGSRGIFVTLWQCTVVCYGYNPKGIDGKFGSGCGAATNSLFKAKGVSQDSVVNGSDVAKVL